MSEKDMARKIYRTICANLKTADDEEYNQTLDVLEEMIKLYFLKHNRNKKKLFLAKFSNENGLVESIGFVLACNNKDALNESCKLIGPKDKEYGLYVSDLIDVANRIDKDILIL